MALAQLVTGSPAYPGTGMKPGEMEPFVTIEKDGFIEVACVKDYMLQNGDKFGSNKHEYEVGGSHGVSIVRYNDIIPKEDAASMTREVCFDFCRTLPNMTFFGLAHGRDCYCSPFYQMMAGDSSQCDAVCEGDTTNMCGGMSKSSVFAMHLCADTGAELDAAIEEVTAILKPASSFLEETKETYIDGLGASAAGLQKIFGVGGDPAASNLMQGAKAAAGDIERKHKAMAKLRDELVDLVEKAEGLLKEDVGDDAEKVKEADALKESLKGTLAKGKAAYEELKAMLYDGLDGSGASLKQYKPITYFVDKDELSAPSTCGGSTLGVPVVGKTAAECAAACDEKVADCVGFSYFPSPDGPSLCFLLSKLKSSTYFIKCGEKEGKFLQEDPKRGANTDKMQTICYAKFQQFEGLKLNPDPKGKCDLCLKTLTKADRCFYYEHN